VIDDHYVIMLAFEMFTNEIIMTADDTSIHVKQFAYFGTSVNHRKVLDTRRNICCGVLYLVADDSTIVKQLREAMKKAFCCIASSVVLIQFVVSDEK